MLYIRETQGAIANAVARLEQATTDNHFGVIAVHDLREKLAAKGVELGRDCIVVEVCNPQRAKEVLEANMSISTALPCRISVYTEGEKIKMATLKPTAVLGFFDRSGLQEIARNIEETIIRIIDQACGD